MLEVDRGEPSVVALGLRSPLCCPQQRGPGKKPFRLPLGAVKDKWEKIRIPGRKGDANDDIGEAEF